MNPLTKNKRLATVAVGLNGKNHIYVLMREDETEEELKLRVENSSLGPSAKVIYVVPKIVNNKDVPTISDDVLKMLRKNLNKLIEEKEE